MRGLLALIAFAALVEPAFAQTTDWHHPRGLYSFSLGGTGWRQVSPEREGLLAEFRLSSEVDGSPICVVSERLVPLRASISQSQLNQRTSIFEPAPDGRTISDLSTSELNGVAIRRFRSQDATSVAFLGIFVIVEGGTGAAHELNCRAPLPISSDNERAALAFMNSLQISQPISAPTGWTSPDGAFTVTIPPGWQRIDRFVEGPYLLAIGPSQETARPEGRDLEVCSVEGRSIETTQRSQDQINEMVESMRAPLLAELQATVIHTSSSDLVDGVQVVTIEIDRQGSTGPTRQMQRMFALPSESGMIHYQIGCGASGTAFGAADLDAMHNFIASLSLNAGTTP